MAPPRLRSFHIDTFFDIVVYVVNIIKYQLQLF